MSQNDIFHSNVVEHQVKLACYTRCSDREELIKITLTFSVF